jgi:hypothetical protein
VEFKSLPLKIETALIAETLDYLSTMFDSIHESISKLNQMLQ